MKQKFRLHVLGVPHTKTNLDYVACAYTQKVYKFCKMMTERGHCVIHYGVEGSTPICTENVNVVSVEIYDKVYGDHDFRSKWFRYDLNDECYQTFFTNAVKEINQRKGAFDIVLPFWGSGVKPVCDALDPHFVIIEPGIGYGEGSWCQFRVFESYSIYHAYCGTQSIVSCGMNNYDIVIPNYFDKKDFSFNPDFEGRLRDDPYFLFIGRVYDGKGVNIAMQVCEKLGVKLKVAGQLSESYSNFVWPKNVEFVGYVNKDQRSELMRGAIASFLPSQYLEPFGGVQIENLLCGTPTITADWGAFAENNINGITGYRCRTFEDYLNAAINCYEGKIRPSACYTKGQEFVLENIAPKYEKFFQDVYNLYLANGWYELDEETKKRLKNFRLKFEKNKKI
jgi:glycosyltransferase involved in cell wall biosynthesis